MGNGLMEQTPNPRSTREQAQRKVDQSSRQLEGILQEAFHQCGSCPIEMLTAEDIVTLIRERWDELSLYAHRIHNALWELDHAPLDLTDDTSRLSAEYVRERAAKRKAVERRKSRRGC